MATRLATAFVEITTRDEQLHRGLGRARSAVSSGVTAMTSRLGMVSAAIGVVMDGVARAGQTMTAAVTAPIVGIGVAAAKAAADLEQLKMAFEVMLQSRVEAERLVTALQNMADQTPFTTENITEAAQALLMYGFQVHDLIPMLRVFGDTAAASPLGMEEGLRRIIYAIGQIRAAGRLTGMEARQLTEAGVPVWHILAKQLGKSTSEIREMVSAGAISAGTAINALLAGLGERFGGMMARQATTFWGRWSTLIDRIKRTLQDIGAPLLDAAQDIFTALEPVLEWVRRAARWFATLPQPVKLAAAAFAAVVASIGPLLMLLAQLPMAIGGLAIATPVVLTFGSMLRDLGLVAAPIILMLRQQWPAIKAAVLNFWAAVKPALTQLWTTLRELGETARVFYGRLFAAFTAAAAGGADTLARFGNVLGKVASYIINAGEWAIRVLNAFWSTINAVITRVLQLTRGVLQFMKPAIEFLAHLRMPGAEWALNKLEAALRRIDAVLNGMRKRGVLEDTKQTITDIAQEAANVDVGDDLSGIYRDRAEAILDEVDAMRQEREEQARARRERIGFIGVAEIGRRAAVAGAGAQFGLDGKFMPSRVPAHLAAGFAPWRTYQAADARLAARERKRESQIQAILQYLGRWDQALGRPNDYFGGRKG